MAQALPFLKTVFPEAHAMVSLLCPCTHRICQSLQPPRSGTPSAALSAQPQGPLIPPRPLDPELTGLSQADTSEESLSHQSALQNQIN